MKRLYLFLLSFLCGFVLTAQSFTPPAFADIDSNYRNYVNNVFGALEANRVTTGFLADYGFDFTDPKFYNGSVVVDSTLMEQGIYSDLYKTIFTSRFNNNTGTLRHPSVQDSLCYIARQKEVITLSGLLFKYNAIDPNAQANGKMQTIGGQLRDVYVSGVWQNPYQEFTTVAISPSIISYKLTYCSVVMPFDLFLGNMLDQISSIQFDADDGQGYRTLSFNVPISLNYADTGWKHWIFRVNLTGGQQLYSHSKVHFGNTSNAAGSGGIGARGVADRRRTITAVEAFNGVHGVADIVISYRNVNDPVLRRPLIVAEGLDPGWITSPEEPEGDNTFAGFITTVQNSHSLTLQNLIADAQNPNLPSEYDIVYVNWRNGTDWLQRNEFVLEEVIRWVNQNKQPLNGVRQPNVVLGSSMGGVIARMALGRMERGEGTFNGNGGYNAHETSLYISLDGPHQGANVPLGYQALARHATRMYLRTGPVAVVTEVVQFLRNGPSPLLTLLLADQPASRQLLTNRIDFDYNIANATNQQFLQDLRTNWHYPANIRRIAISNGNECAIGQEFDPGSSLLYIYRSVKTRFIGDLIFMAVGAGLDALHVPSLFTIPLTMPGSNKFELTFDVRALANGGGNQVYYGNIKLTKKVVWLLPVSINLANKTYNAPSGLLPFDTYPGGFYTVALADQPGTASQDWMFSYDNSFFIQHRFTFIPTTSALDIGEGNTTLTDVEYTARYIGATPPAIPLQTPFQNFTTGYNRDGSPWLFTNSTFRNLNNEPHEFFFLRNANWLAAEMAVTNPQPQFTDCSAFCQSGSITGNILLCNSETYTAPFGQGVNYTWTISDPNLVTPNPVGNTLQLTRSGSANGQLTITVTISGDCGAATFSKVVTVGAPAYGIIADVPCQPGRTVQTSTFTAFPAAQVPTTYHWGAIQNGSFSTIPGNGPSVTKKFALGGPYTVTSWASNACGAGDEAEVEFQVVSCPGGGQMLVYPNPSTSTLNVSVSENENVSASEIQTVEILDKVGILRLKKQYSKGTKKISLPVSQLPNDVYTLRVFDGKEWTAYQISIHH